jgi:uncharacterized protein (TIGR03437 family)
MRNRVLLLTAACAVLPVAALAQTLNQTPSRVVGQPSLTFRSANPNVVEGREFLSPWAVVVDRTTNPPSLYVSDFGNNRVLGWRDAAGFANGAAANLVIGQLDMTSTLPMGPGTSRTTGLNRPGGLAVDSAGNLYVVDGGNNRILRFPKPFTAPDGIPLPDLVIGQPGFATEAANFGGLSARSIAISSGSAIGRNSILFDAQGNLWLTDSLNNRVLRYPAAQLTPGRPEQIAADLVLGQTSFETSQPQDTSNTARLNKSLLRTPGGIAIDSDGRVYVSDTGNGSAGRVLVFEPSFFNGKAAARIVGIDRRPPAQQVGINEYFTINPEGLFLINNRLGLADPALNRILIYDPYASWPPETEERVSPPATAVLGQDGFGGILPNRNRPEPGADTLNGPVAGYYTGSELYVVDSGNHRVLVFPQQATNAAATRVLGQTGFNFGAANLVEGKELFIFGGFGDITGQTLADGGGIAIDRRIDSIPRLYVADTYNNRVLGYADARLIRPGQQADVVIGQADLQRVMLNAPGGRADIPGNSGLFRPSGLAVDNRGDLWVADSGNGRVLRFPRPFEQQVAPGERRQANLVLGQSSFTTKLTDASARTMAYPFGLAFTVDGHVVVSDAVHSRVLMFRRPAGGDYANGQAADLVIAQPDFFTVGRSNASNRLNSPRHIAIDTDDRLYVTDAGNNRVLVYDRITATGNDPTPAFTLTGVNAPHGIFVSTVTGEIWVANTKGNRATRFPRYDQLAFSTQSNFDIPSATPLAVTQDSTGNLYIAEGTNRVAVHYNALAFTVAGNYAQRPLSPAGIGILWKIGQNPDFAGAITAASRVPLSKDLGDVQVLLNDQPLPLYLVSPSQINFVVPNNAPNSGSAEIQVVKKSTGQIIAVSNVPFERVSPALFTSNDTGEGQVAAVNEDGTVNSSASPVQKGRVISLYGTGQGAIPNAPPDGEGATGPLPAQEAPLRVLIGTDFVRDEDVLYSGLAPGYPGLWQINVRVPDNVDVSRPVPVAVQLRSVPSTIPIPNSSRRLNTTISVRP